MKAALIYNPAAGGGEGIGRRAMRRVLVLERVAEVLSGQGYDVETIATTGPGSAAAQVVEAVARGVGIVFACGGDGTVHEVLQGMMQAGPCSASLAVLPFGSANALARDLGLSRNVVEAARQYARFGAKKVPVGLVEVGGQRRYFTVLAGAGPDGALVYRLMTMDKRGVGRYAYYLRALLLFLRMKFEPFNVEIAQSGTGTRSTEVAVSALVVRISDIEGIFRGLARGSALDGSVLRLMIVRPPGRLGLCLWFLSSWTRLQRFNPLLRLVEADEFQCSGIGQGIVHVQADGEPLGRAPMRVTLLPDGLRLMMPLKAG